MKYGYTIIYVENVETTATFYKKAFGFDTKFITPEGDYGELISGETTLAFASYGLGNSNLKGGFQKSAVNQKPFGAELVFVTETIEDDFKKALDGGALLYEPIVEKPWGQKVGYVRDNNGFLIEICTPVTTK